MSSNCKLLIVGAGAAGMGAAHAAMRKGLDFKIVEASHRVGGRGLTEELAPGIPWDLGCHWLHSGSINPLAKVADQLDLHYDKGLSSRGFYLKGQWLCESERNDYEDFSNKIWQNIENATAKNSDIALSDFIDLDSRWAPYYVSVSYTHLTLPTTPYV